ncbi:hypothetical protein HMI56_004869 [Coelomomyces lativittatus]|nr:hypothetical protein HMI56_004869 [Coelomomyces lativittatus]
MLNDHLEKGIGTVAQVYIDVSSVNSKFKGKLQELKKKIDDQKKYNEFHPKMIIFLTKLQMPEGIIDRRSFKKRSTKYKFIEDVLWYQKGKEIL